MVTGATGRGQVAADGRIRLVAGLALFALAAITAIVSYLHALAVVRSVGNTGPVAYLIPCVADLMIVSASMVLLEAARNSAAKPTLAVVSLVFGIGATLAMKRGCWMAPRQRRRAGRSAATGGPGTEPRDADGPSPPLSRAPRRFRRRPGRVIAWPVPAPGGHDG